MPLIYTCTRKDKKNIIYVILLLNRRITAQKEEHNLYKFNVKSCKKLHRVYSFTNSIMLLLPFCYMLSYIVQ